MDKKLLHKNIMESLSKTLGKTLNEGAGAGYTVSISGLSLDEIDENSIRRSKDSNGEPIFKFKASLSDSLVEWKAEDYYDGVTSDGIYYNGDIIEDFNDEQRTIDGGTIEGHVYVSDVKDYLDENIVTKDDVIDYIQYHLDDEFSIETMYGRGWVHVDLDDPMEFHDIEIKDSYGVVNVFIDTIIINAPEITKTINWFFAHKDEIYKEFEDEEISESLNHKKSKIINESFTMDHELQSILRKFHVFIDMGRFEEIAYNEELDELDPSLQRIISMYDPYVKEVIGELQNPNSDIAYDRIVRMAEDNERRTGTEANMVVDFLEELYTWCLKHGLEKPTLRESVKIKTKKKSVTEDLTKADKEDAESKMDKWHEGKRKQNVKACSTDKLIMNLGICKRKGYDAEAQQLQDELDARGINESQLFEGEVSVHTFEPEFDEVIEHVKNGTVDTEKDSEILFDALVPVSGHADSLGGELLRAAERIAYRYFNDGDKAGEGYGQETVNPAVRYMIYAIRPATSPLYSIVDDFYKFVERSYVNVSDKEYESMVMRLLKLTVIHIVENKLWDVPNQKDMLDFRDPKMDVDRDDEWEDEDW